MAQEENREDEQALPPEETEEEEAPVEEEDPEEKPESEQDIDFEKELEALEGQVPAEDPAPQAPTGKTEEQKAGYTVRETIKRLKKQGKSDAEISELVGFEVKTSAEEPADPEREQGGKQFVTAEDLDLRDAALEAGRLARSEAEKKVIMHYVKHNRLSVHDAHLLANKGRIKANAAEIQRAGESRPAAPGASGRREPTDQKPRFTKAEMEAFQRRGMQWNPQTKQMEGKFTFVRIDPKTGDRINGRLEKPKR